MENFNDPLLTNFTTFVGIDLHKTQSTIAVMNKDGQIIKQTTLPNIPTQILEFLKPFDSKNTIIGIESTYGWYWQYDLLKKQNYTVLIGNPYKLSMNNALKKKTDKLDAKMLAHYLRINAFPYIDPIEGYHRELLEMLKVRYNLLKTGAKYRTRIMAQLAKANIHSPFKDPFGVKGIEWLKEQKLPEYIQDSIDVYLKEVELNYKWLEEQGKKIRHFVSGDNIIKILQKIPGVGELTSWWLKATIRDINRFPNDKYLASYFGLAPSTYQSSNNIRHGHITKLGNKRVRHLMVIAAHTAARSNEKSLEIFKRISRRRGQKIAYVALARKLLTMVYYRWKHGLKN